MKALLYIQCTDEGTGACGTFLAPLETKGRRAISPVFNQVSDLFRWCKENGWKALPYSSEYPVGAYQQVGAP